MQINRCVTQSCAIGVVALFAVTANGQVPSTCAAVYANNVRNISINIQQRAEYDYVHDEHCETNGEIKTKTQSFDFRIPIKKLDLKFAGTNDEAKQKMQEFCKSHLQERVALGQSNDIKYEVVTDALRSLNECVALEGKGVFVSHALQEPRSVVVRADFNPATTVVQLRGVLYDTRVATCRTTGLSESGTPVILGKTTKEQKMSRPFSVVCERKASKTNGGSWKFERLSLGLDTNHGTYSVVMPPEEVLGFDLARANQERYIALQAKLTAEESAHKNDSAALRAKFDSIEAETHLVRIGEKAAGGFWEHVACAQNGGDLGAHIRATCGNKRVGKERQLMSHGGNRCGYTYFAYSCISK